MDGEIQVAILLHTMGESCLDIYNTFVLTEAEKKDYDAVINKFKEYFVPKTNESVNSHIFLHRIKRK